MAVPESPPPDLLGQQRRTCPLTRVASAKRPQQLGIQSPASLTRSETPAPLTAEEKGKPEPLPPTASGLWPAGTHMMLALCTAVTLLRWLLRAYSKANSAMRLLAPSVMSLMLCTTPSTICGERAPHWDGRRGPRGNARPAGPTARMGITEVQSGPCPRRHP